MVESCVEVKTFSENAVAACKLDEDTFEKWKPAIS